MIKPSKAWLFEIIFFWEGGGQIDPQFDPLVLFKEELI